VNEAFDVQQSGFRKDKGTLALPMKMNHATLLAALLSRDHES
jgi:hypothetical protein